MQKGSIVPLVSFLALGLLLVGTYVWYVYSPSLIDSSSLPKRQVAEEEVIPWERRADMPTARTEISAAALEDKIYVVGGMNGVAASLATVEIYDTASDSWSSAPDLPEKVHHTAVVSYEGKLYVIGGYRGIGSVPVSSVYIYDPTLNSWSTGVPLPEGRGAHGAAVLGNHIYVVGGVTGQGLSSELLRFSFTTNEWEKLPAMPTARDHLAVAAVNNQLLVAGGREQSLRKNLGILEIFTVFPEGAVVREDSLTAKEPPIGEWEAGPNMPTERGGVTGTLLGTAIVVSGGEKLTGTFSEVEAYDIRTQRWHSFPSLNYSRHGAASAVVDNTLYVIGGGRRPALSVSKITESLEVEVR